MIELSGAVHERIATEHDPYDPGVVLHEPLEQVDETATDEHADGEVTDEAVYEEHVPPLAAEPQAPDAAQPGFH